jgi:tetratricopeptide (TPR) repeat protein
MKMLAAALLIALAPPARAQTVARYLMLAREYAAGDGEDATRQLAAWSPDDVTAAADQAMLTGSVHDLVAAAMLHTDVANVVIDTSPQKADFHLKKARGALTAASGRIGERERLEPFVRRWFRFVASVYTSCELLKAASDHVQLGLLRFPEDSSLYVARGVILEVSVRKSLVPDWRRGDSLSGRGQAVEDVLTRAAQQYLHALSVDSHNPTAHLHLGWVRFVLEDKRAKADLEAALSDATDDTVRYLAHLFLGGLAERENRAGDARREYEEAGAIGDGYQTPHVALSRVDGALGDNEHAREHALIAVQLKKSDDDPWWDHRIGFDRESLRWLRAEARKP